MNGKTMIKPVVLQQHEERMVYIVYQHRVVTVDVIEDEIIYDVVDVVIGIWDTEELAEEHLEYLMYRFPMLKRYYHVKATPINSQEKRERIERIQRLNEASEETQ